MKVMPRGARRNANPLPLFEWAEARAVLDRHSFSVRTIGRRYRLKPARARLIADLAGLGGGK